MSTHLQCTVWQNRRRTEEGRELRMTLNEERLSKNKTDLLPGDSYLMKDSKCLDNAALKSVSIVLHERGFDLYSYAQDYESISHETVEYTQTVIRCSLKELVTVATSIVMYVVQLEAGLKTIFICFTDRDERDACFTKILASVGEFLVLNPRSRKRLLGKRLSNPLSPVSPLSISNGANIKEQHLSLLLDALDITHSSSTCLPMQTLGMSLPCSIRFPSLLVSLCNSRQRRSKARTTRKVPVTRSYTYPFFNKYGSSCKQFSARNSIFSVDSHNKRSSTLQTRVALGILNTDLGDVRQYLTRS